MIAVWNWDWFRSFAAAEASLALGRKVTITHLGVRLGRVTQITASGITIANPDRFAKPGDFATVERLEVDVDVLAYLEHQQLLLTKIQLDRPSANLEQLSSGQDNYTLVHKPGGGGTAIQIGNLVINDGQASVISAKYKTNMQLAFATRTTPGMTASDILVTAKGLYNGKAITGRLIGGALLSLRDAAQPYPVDLHLANGSTSISLVGTISDPLRFTGADLKLALSGQDMSELYPLTNIPLPATPPYSIGGQLDYTKGTIAFHDFSGRLGSSDVKGTITYTVGPPGSKPLVTAVLASNRVDLTDLAGFLGGQPGNAATPGQTHATAQKIAKAEASPKLLPSTPINLPRLNAANFEVRYRGAHIINKNVPLDNVTANLSIEDGGIVLHPFNFAVGSGTIASNVDLKETGGVLHATANIQVRQVPLARIMAATKSFAGDGIIAGSAHIVGTGNSLAVILGHGDGKMQLFMSHGGDINSLLVDLTGLQFGDAVLSALGVPQRTSIQCLISDFTLTAGQMKTNTLLLATTEANILGSGTANLADETLNLALRTEATHFSIGSLSTPIDIGGTFKHATILPEAGPLAARAVPAVGLGLLFPPLALLPTIRLGLGDKNACADTLATLHGNPPRHPG